MGCGETVSPDTGSCNPIVIASFAAQMMHHLPIRRCTVPGCVVPSAHRALARTSVARRSPPFQPFSLLHLSWLGRGGKEGGHGWRQSA